MLEANLVVSSTASAVPAPTSSAGVSPRMEALASHIKTATEQLHGRERGSGRHDHDGLRFLGNWHDDGICWLNKIPT